MKSHFAAVAATMAYRCNTHLEPSTKVTGKGFSKTPRHSFMALYARAGLAKLPVAERHQNNRPMNTSK